MDSIPDDTSLSDRHDDLRVRLNRYYMAPTALKARKFAPLAAEDRNNAGAITATVEVARAAVNAYVRAVGVRPRGTLRQRRGRGQGEWAMGGVTLKLRRHPHDSGSAMAGTAVSVSEMDPNLSQRRLPRLAETEIRSADGEHAAPVLRAVPIVPGSVLGPYERGTPVGGAPGGHT